MLLKQALQIVQMLQNEARADMLASLKGKKANIRVGMMEPGGACS